MEMFDPLIQQFRQTGIDQTSFSFLDIIGQNGQEFFRRFKASTVQQGALLATTSGTTAAFTGLPEFLKWIIFGLNVVSGNGTSNPIIQIGDSGGFETTGYTGSTWNESGSSTANFTSGFMLSSSSAATTIYNGVALLIRLDEATNLWACGSLLGLSNAAGGRSSAGIKALSATLDRIQLTFVNGTDAFDAGSVNWIGG